MQETNTHLRFLSRTEETGAAAHRLQTQGKGTQEQKHAAGTGPQRHPGKSTGIVLLLKTKIP